MATNDSNFNEQNTALSSSATASSTFNNTIVSVPVSFPCTSLSVNESTRDELKSVVSQLQSQIEHLLQQQSRLSDHLQGLDYGYNDVMETVADVKKYMVSQDQFMNQLATRILATHQQQQGIVNHTPPPIINIFPGLYI